MNLYMCEKCGNILEVVNDGGVVPVCCGDNMKLIVPNNNDTASKEKHVPVVKDEGFLINVKIGEEAHPMSEEHYIEWIALETNKGIYKKYLNPNDLPEKVFVLDKNETVKNVYAYCNIHGLWCVCK